MPARCLTLIAVLFLVPLCVEAQTVTLQANVSETVALSILPNFTHNNVDLNVVNSGSTVRLTLSSTNAEVRVPLLVRSNSSFKVSVDIESQTEVPTHVSVIDVRPTGSLVSPEVVNALVSSEIDLDASQPLLVLSGPRVSLGGTLNSPNNALQVTLRIRMQPQAAHGSLVHLTFTGTAAPLIP
ncbi:MAG TPA: hypothetical protein VF435_12070 [Pyrinomonadaceae bacterium]